MAKKSFVTSQALGETGNWNIAGYYALNKIGLPSIKLDEYETVAMYGTNELVDEFMTSEQVKTMARIKALDRFAHTLRLLISNTKFAVKKENKLKLDEYKETIKVIQKVIPSVKIIKVNQKDKTEYLKIDEEKFTRLLNMLIDIKEDLNEPLNEASLIFTNIEEFDVDNMKSKYLNELMRGG